VIHRDIKPDNIMVVGDEDVEKVKLMDFGIARLRDSGSMSRLTRAGVVMGTPAYMAPEQAEGAEVSERTDIYALGIVLYEMLSGSVPFRASTPGAVLVKQIQERPLALRSLRCEIPPAIEQAVMQALEKDPNKRQRDMREVAQGLKRVDRPAIDEPIPGTMIGESTTMIDAVAQTIAATQISQSGLAAKPKSAGKYLIIGLVAVIAVGALIFALLRPSNPPVNDHVARSDAKIKVKDEFANQPAPTPSAAKPLEVLPSPSSVAAKGAATQKTDRPNTGADSAAIQNYIKWAKSLRERGDYANARLELEKANAIAPGNAAVRAEIENVKKACNVERDILGQTSLNCG
jgi:serine/threonine protein kinase